MISREKKVVFVVGFGLLYGLYRRFKEKSNNIDKEIPIPSYAYPYFGHILSLGQLPGIKISEWHKELGPIIKIFMGSQIWISIDDPILAHKIFVKHGVEASYRPHSSYAYYHYSMGGKGVAFAQPGAGWKDARSIVISVLGPKQIEKYMESIHQQAQDLVTRLINQTENDGNTELYKHLNFYSLNIIFSACFGREFYSVNDPEFINIIQMINTSLELAAMKNDLPNFLPVLSIIDYLIDIQKKMRSFISEQRNPTLQKLIKEAIANTKPNIVKYLEKESGHNLSEDEKIVLMFDFIGGGTESVAVTLQWNIAIMCNYPQAQKLVSSEIDTFIHLNGRLPNFKERKQVPYCISVIKECMRFRPTTAFGLPHAVKNDVTVDGYVIPKGATIISNMESMHKNPTIYSDPEIFKPERFMNNLQTMQSSANGKLEKRDHYNFGWGRRVCPAIYLAEVEIFSAFVKIFSQCLIEPGSEGLPNIDKIKNHNGTISPFPYNVKFIKRKDAVLYE